MLFDRDAEFSRYYNKELASGKWNNMMNQTHISYTTRQQPDKDVLPEVKTIDLPNRSEMGVAVEGSNLWWLMEKTQAILPEFDSDNKQHFYIDVFNRGSESFTYTIQTVASWILFSEIKGRIEKEKRIDISINWKVIPSGKNAALISIKGSDGNQIVVQVTSDNTLLVKEASGFIEHNGYISIEADHFSKAVNSPKGTWTVLPDHGRTGSSVTTFPVTSPSALIDKDSPYLEYPIHLTDADSL